MFKDKNVFVLGMARSGYEVAKLLASKGNKVLVTDKSEQDKDHVLELEKLGVKVVITDNPLELFDDSFDMVVKNPGINKSHPIVSKANELNKKVINEVEVAYHFIPKDVKIIAITGSNGKTTTTTLAYEMLKAAKMPVHIAGNIGIPLSGIVNNVVSGDVLVLEISSHQLVDMYDFHPNISVVTNLTPTHLDFFGDYDAYVINKGRIFNNQTNEDLAILNAGYEEVDRISKDIKCQKLRFSAFKEANICIKDGGITFLSDRIVNISDIRIKGKHNYENIMCAIIIAKAFDVKNEIIRNVLRNFSGVEHRNEFVREINGREFYNDSKATNTKSTMIALDSFDKDTILIMGGLDRGHEFDELNDHLNNVTHIICYGETKNRIESWAQSQNKSCVVVDNLSDAVRASYNLSKPEDVILLSPACASWDQYKDFEERGNEFKLLVKEIN